MQWANGRWIKRQSTFFLVVIDDKCFLLGGKERMVYYYFGELTPLHAHGHSCVYTPLILFALWWADKTQLNRTQTKHFNFREKLIETTDPNGSHKTASSLDDHYTMLHPSRITWITPIKRSIYLVLWNFSPSGLQTHSHVDISHQIIIPERCVSLTRCNFIKSWHCKLVQC